MMVEELPQTFPESMGEFLRQAAISFDRRMNPVFEGHRTTYPGYRPVTTTEAIGLFSSRTLPIMAGSYASSELMLTPVRTVGIDVSPQGSYHLSAGDDTYYPFKGIIDLLFD